MAQEQNITTEGVVTPQKRTLETSVAFIVSSVLLIIALFIGGMWMMGGDMGMTNDGAEKSESGMPNKAGSVATEAETVATVTELQTQGSSDELGSIEADLSATNLDSLDGIDQIQ